MSGAFEKTPGLIQRISHGYVVQEIDPDTFECKEEQFVSLETLWEDELGHSLDISPELEEKPFPIIVKSQREVNEVPLHTLL